jgi:hypothetical protein
METKKATKVTGCNTCKKGLNKKQKGFILFSFLIFTFTLYGIYKLFQLIYNLF